MASDVLLLGANGYVGKYLNSIFDFTPITRKECDLSDRESVERLLKKHKPDVVINCAANLNLELQPFNQNHFIDNLKIFLNLYSLKDNFGKLINFGSGAEFDRSKNIDNALEKDIRRIKPKDHYGLSKNIISNICLETPNFYTLRLFGCIHQSEPMHKLFKRILTSKIPVDVYDRYFDYIWLEDLKPIVHHFINNNPILKDINLVYKQKFLLSELINKFIKTHNINVDEPIYKFGGLNYTGSSALIDSLNLPLCGIDVAIESYKI
jgi:UDP-glucose 4-epimerase